MSGLLVLNSNFTIIDMDDQIRLIKNICKAENIDIKQLAPKFILAIIDRWKNKGYYPLEVVINNKDICQYLDMFNTHKKKDDLADCFLQGIWFLKNKKYIY